MRLEKIELRGFKSFADPTVIHFDQKVTGVVGPNGSGKSNIVDAFRWVLGEQKSTQLRLEKMTDVLFNGSDKRKKGNMARVAITFSNTKNILPLEYQTVTIARELHRSGDSHYEINGVKCRLKDIRNLFQDTGIGPNSYAIIALQMVEGILQDNNNERRRMFEQAAGISRYKTRKKETLGKLKLTEGDLDRVEDLLFEIEGNLKTLEKQARRARRYKVLKQDYAELCQQIARLEYDQIETRAAQLKAEIDAAIDTHKSVEASRATQEAEIQQLKSDILSEETQLSTDQKDLNEFLDSLRKQETSKNEKTNELTYLRERLKRSEQQLAAGQQDIEVLDTELIDLSEELTERAAKAITLRAEHEQRTTALRAQEERYGAIKGQHSELAPQLEAARQAIYDREKRQAICENELRQHAEQESRKSTELDQATQQLQDIQLEHDRLTKEEEQLAAQIVELDGRIEAKKDDKTAREAELEENRKAILRTSRILDARTNEYELLKSMVDNLEGFPESIKFLKSNSKWQGNVPLFSDVISCQEKYRSILESYLEPYLNHFIVSDDAEAFQAIRLLSEAQKGRAQFFILSRLSSKSETPTLSGAQRAIDLVEVDDRYAGLVASLLHQVYLWEDVPYNQLKPAPGETYLSIHGQVVYSEYNLSGGSEGLFSGKKIGRKKNLQKLTKEISSLQKDRDKASMATERVESVIRGIDIYSDEKLMKDLQQRRSQVGNKLATAQAQLAGINQRQEQILVEGQQRKTIQEERKAEISQLQEEIKEERLRLADLENRLAEQNESLSKDEHKLTELKTLYSQSEIELIRVESELQSLEKDCGYRKNRVNQLTESSTKLEEEIHHLREKIQTSESEISELTEKLQSSYEEKEQRSSVLTQKEEIYYKKRGAITDLEEKLRKTQQDYLNRQSAINQMKDKLGQVGFDKRAISDRLRIEFQIDIADVPTVEMTDDELIQASVKRDKIQSRIDNYGEINPLAVEAYDEMNLRKETIEGERNDILQAKESLLQTIKEIDETATARYLESFDQINVYFKEVFRTLFSQDDDCQLVLISPDTPLESNIEIIAKPKGKRPRTLSQLSGGEKTLTATALLFSLYLLKPAPFCIFDEVDAPLDDANIQKFNNIIRDFSDRSQFIIVTHNKETMTAMDVIYGVFMDQPGVSRVGAVDFNQVDYAQAG